MNISYGQNGSGVNSRPHIDYSDKDYDSLRTAMLALAKEKLPGWTDHSENDPGVVLLELFAYMSDIILYYQDRIANESFLETAVERRSVINLLRLIGCELRPPQPASVDLTLLFDKDAKGTITVNHNSEFITTTGGAGGVSVSFRYVRQKLPISLDSLRKIEYNGKDYLGYEKLPVIQLDGIIEDEPVGTGDKSSGQRFKLAQTPLVDGSLKVFVGAGKVPWERRDTFFYSNSASMHYVVRRDDSDVVWIEFGDGKFGSCPDGSITASYQVGGGIKGNISPNSIFTVSSGIDDPKLVTVYNLDAATGGTEHEDCVQAVLRGPQLFRARSRAVTREDYETFAKDFGVAKARAKPGGLNTVELYVAPDGGGAPSETLKEDLWLYFEDKRMLSTIVKVCGPKYKDLLVEGILYLKSQYWWESVKRQVEDAVADLLAFENVDFEQKLYVSKLYEIIEAVDGVAGVDITKFKREEDSQDYWPVLKLGWNEIPQVVVSNINFILKGDQSGS